LGWLLDPPQVVDFVEVAPLDFLMIGRVQVLGIPIATLHAAIRREDTAS
jgi:hypothetical protein